MKKSSLGIVWMCSQVSPSSSRLAAMKRIVARLKSITLHVALRLTQTMTCPLMPELCALIVILLSRVQAINGTLKMSQTFSRVININTS